LALEAIGTPRAERPDRIAKLLARVGRGAFAQKYPSQMSGGMQQRLQIARCLAQEPSALMMYEPFGALDAMVRQTLQDQILDIARATSATIFFVTHDLEEAIYLGDSHRSPHPGRVGLTSRSNSRGRAIRSRPGSPRVLEIAPHTLRFHSRERDGGPIMKAKAFVLPSRWWFAEFGVSRGPAI
jgi:NitT/TauT family transport system ATP-binding protein